MNVCTGVVAFIWSSKLTLNFILSSIDNEKLTTKQVYSISRKFTIRKSNFKTEYYSYIKQSVMKIAENINLLLQLVNYSRRTILCQELLNCKIDKSKNLN